MPIFQGGFFPNRFELIAMTVPFTRCHFLSRSLAQSIDRWSTMCRLFLPRLQTIYIRSRIANLSQLYVFKALCNRLRSRRFLPLKDDGESGPPIQTIVFALCWKILLGKAPPISSSMKWMHWKFLSMMVFGVGIVPLSEYDQFEFEGRFYFPDSVMSNHGSAVFEVWASQLSIDLVVIVSFHFFTFILHLGYIC